MTREIDTNNFIGIRTASKLFDGYPDQNYYGIRRDVFLKDAVPNDDGWVKPGSVVTNNYIQLEGQPLIVKYKEEATRRGDHGMGVAVVINPIQALGAIAAEQDFVSPDHLKVMLADNKLKLKAGLAEKLGVETSEDGKPVAPAVILEKMIAKVNECATYAEKGPVRSAVLA